MKLPKPKEIPGGEQNVAEGEHTHIQRKEIRNSQEHLQLLACSFLNNSYSSKDKWVQMLHSVEEVVKYITRHKENNCEKHRIKTYNQKMQKNIKV